MSTVIEERVMIVAPFGIEADHPRNADLGIQCIPGMKLRSAIDGTKTVRDVKTGDLLVPLDQSHHLASFPKTPGVQLHVNPAALSYIVIDPLKDDEDMCARITRWMKNNGPFRVDDGVKGQDTQNGTLDKNRMKSLCREMVWIVDANEAKRVKGPMPTIEELEDLPGEFLLNPGSRIGNSQPQFECDFEDWVSNLNRMGG